MARKFDMDGDNEEYGLVGGEMTSASSASAGCHDYSIPLECHEDADMLSGPEYAYLGHFRQQKYARAGHNSMYLQEPGLAPMEVGGTNIPQSPALPQPKMGRRAGGGLLGGMLGGGNGGTGGLY